MLPAEVFLVVHVYVRTNKIPSVFKHSNESEKVSVVLGKSYGVVKKDIQNKINHLLGIGKRHRDTRDYDNVLPVLNRSSVSNI